MSEYFRLKACLRHPWAGSNEHSRVLDHSIFKSLLVPYSENFTTQPSSRLVAIFIFLVIIIQILDNFYIFWQLLTLLTIFDIFWQSWPFLPFWQFWQFPTMYTIFGNCGQFSQFRQFRFSCYNFDKCFYHFDNSWDLWRLRHFS